MAVRIDDQLAKLLDCSRVNNRRDIWLCFYLIEKGVRFLYEDINSFSMRDKIAESLMRHEDLLPNIRRVQDRRLLQDGHLEWISEDRRQHLWLISRLENKNLYSSFRDSPHLLGRDQVIAMIDAWRTDLDRKLCDLSDLHLEWEEQKKKDKLLDWFKADNERERCSYAWEWLTKNHHSKTPYIATVGSHNELLIAFDKTSLSDAEKTLHIQTIKKRWTQQNSRQKMVSKKQCNFILSNKAIGRLDKLAGTHELSRSQILEILLRMECEKGLYIAEMIRLLKNIDA